MSEVELAKVVNGQKLDDWIINPSNRPGAGVARVVRNRAREIEATAEEILVRQHRDTGATKVEARQMRQARGRFASGWEVMLVDYGAGYQGAIEYGRKDYLVENSDEARKYGYAKVVVARRIKGVPQAKWKLKVRRYYGEQYGGMEGLFILQKAIKAVAARHRIELR